MEYSDDAFHTFMDLDSAIYLAVNGTDMGVSEKRQFSFWGGVDL